MPENVRVVSLHNAQMTSDSDPHGTALDLGPYINVGKREAIGVWNFYVSAASTDQTVDCKFQASDVGGTVSSDWSDITGATFTQVAHSGSAFADATQSIRFVPTARYLRDLVTLAGTSAAGHTMTAVVLHARQDT